MRDPGLVHVVPVEAIRHGVTLDGALTLTRLAAEYAQFQPSATVELLDAGWVATLVYSRPGFPTRVHHAHVNLSWAPLENRSRTEGGQQPENRQ